MMCFRISRQIVPAGRASNYSDQVLKRLSARRRPSNWNDWHFWLCRLVGLQQLAGPVKHPKHLHYS